MDFESFKEKVRTTFRIDLSAYKENQLKRRLDGLLARNKVAAGDYAKFYELITADEKARLNFLDTITINVSEFFRDKHLFLYLEEKVLPALLEKKKTLKVWSAACSSGAEPYSLAIILDELTPGRRHHIEATDIDKNILRAAVEARYTADQVRNVSPARLKKYFVQEGNQYVLSPHIRRMVTFKHHDLLLDPFGQGYDLISCRNVTIYFTREAQEKLNARLVKALAPGGVLFIGASEMIFGYQEIGLEKLHSCFYRKKG